MQTRHLILSIVITLSACAAPPPPPAREPAPMPKPVIVTPAQPLLQTGDWTVWRLAAGEWVYRRDERGSVALFGVSGENAKVTLRCDTSRKRVYLAREGSATIGKTVIRSSSSMKEFAANPTGGTPPYLASEIMPNDPILDAMAFSRGRIAIEVTGQPPVAIPSWAEITKIVEDCRA